MGLFIFIGLLGSFEQYGEFFKFFARFNPFYLAYIGALIVIISGCIKPKEAYQAVDWGIIFLILGMLCVGEAMSKTGLAKAIAFGVVDNIGPLGCLVAISGLYLICSILTEMISNNAVAAVMGPLAYEMALQFDANPIPFILAVMFGASASFSTPSATRPTLTCTMRAVTNLRTSSKWDSPQPAPLGHFYLRHRLVVSAQVER